jgi:hypothetical protein
MKWTTWKGRTEEQLYCTFPSSPPPQYINLSACSGELSEISRGLVHDSTSNTITHTQIRTPPSPPFESCSYQNVFWRVCKMLTSVSCSMPHATQTLWLLWLCVVLQLKLHFTCLIPYLRIHMRRVSTVAELTLPVPVWRKCKGKAPHHEDVSLD